jgi:hypothetical protein
VERTPLVCAVCDGYLTLDDPVVGYAGHPVNGDRRHIPRFVHPACQPLGMLVDPALVALGERPLREFVLAHLHDESIA